MLLKWHRNMERKDLKNAKTIILFSEKMSTSERKNRRKRTDDSRKSGNTLGKGKNSTERSKGREMTGKFNRMN
jgi:hypothetical protein